MGAGAAGGGTEVYFPVLTREFTGWSMTQFTSTQSPAILGSAVFALTAGGWIVSRFGGKRTLAVVLPMVAALSLILGFSKPLWSDGGFMTVAIWSQELIGITYAAVPSPWRCEPCSPSVAATQFTIYMAIANFGRPIGASLSGATTGGPTPELFFFIVAGLFAVGAAAIWLFRPETANACADTSSKSALGTAPGEH